MLWEALGRNASPCPFPLCFLHRRLNVVGQPPALPWLCPWRRLYCNTKSLFIKCECSLISHSQECFWLVIMPAMITKSGEIEWEIPIQVCSKQCKVQHASKDLCNVHACTNIACIHVHTYSTYYNNDSSDSWTWHLRNTWKKYEHVLNKCGISLFI